MVAENRKNLPQPGDVAVRRIPFEFPDDIDPHWKPGEPDHPWVRAWIEGYATLPAATVLPLRDGDTGIETLMLRHDSKIAFGGMWVFPGGRVDADDVAAVAHGDEIAAARLTAVRETREETGLALDASVLVPLAHWTPAPIAPRRFLTWFFVAPAPAGTVIVDDGEIRQHEWMSAPRAIALRDAGEIELAPPTWITLHTMTGWDSVGDALARCRAARPERFETRIDLVDDVVVALWHGDAGYEESDATRTGPRHRLAMNRGPGATGEPSSRPALRELPAAAAWHRSGFRDIAECRRASSSVRSTSFVTWPSSSSWPATVSTSRVWA